MAEQSWFWDGTTLGDATLAPYSADEFTDVFRKLLIRDRTVMGVVNGYNNELAVTGATSPVSVDTGAALVDGTFYENTASLNVTVPTPGGATRQDRIVLRKSWASQTVRVTRIEGVEGGGVPALTQSDGVTWDVTIATVSITTLGAITVTDSRIWVQTPLSPVQLEDVNTTDSTVGNTAAETTIYSTTLRAGKLGTANIVKIRAAFHYLNNSGAARNLTFTFYYGGVSISSFTISTIAASATEYAGFFDAWLEASGATNTQSTVTGAFLANNANSYNNSDSGTGAIDSTVDQTLQVKVTHSAANANLTITFMAVTTELFKESY